MNSLYFKIKDTVDVDKHQLLELFFKDWIDDACDRQVEYKIEKNFEEDRFSGLLRYKETFRVDFKKQEDFVALKLRGIPSEFRNFLEVIN